MIRRGGRWVTGREQGRCPEDTGAGTEAGGQAGPEVGGEPWKEKPSGIANV